jgi:predicted enzyme related to lactoylglutathione lyase
MTAIPHRIGGASDFYEQVFGWRLKDAAFEGYRSADTGDGSGIDGAIMARTFETRPAIAWVGVDDIDAAIDRVRRAGGSTLNEKNTIPGQGPAIYVRDTEGNVLGLLQPM